MEKAPLKKAALSRAGVVRTDATLEAFMETLRSCEAHGAALFLFPNSVARTHRAIFKVIFLNDYILTTCW